MSKKRSKEYTLADVHCMTSHTAWDHDGWILHLFFKKNLVHGLGSNQ